MGGCGSVCSVCFPQRGQFAVSSNVHGHRAYTSDADLLDSMMKDRVKEEFVAMDKDGSGTLDYKEIIKLVQKLNLRLPTSVLKEKFKRIDLDEDGNLTFEEFDTFWKSVHSAPDLNEIFQTYADINNARHKSDDSHKFSDAQSRGVRRRCDVEALMSTRGLAKFFKIEQGLEVTVEDVAVIIATVCGAKQDVLSAV